MYSVSHCPGSVILSSHISLSTYMSLLVRIGDAREKTVEYSGPCLVHFCLCIYSMNRTPVNSESSEMIADSAFSGQLMWLMKLPQ